MAAGLNKKMFQNDGVGGYKLRVWHRKGEGKMSPRYLIKCGDCSNGLEVYYGGGFLEICGVHASLGEWRKILLPLLETSP
ncbi:MAG: hypothetical protein GXO65_06735 [Euryarchaeota archaeon]|nr:hypothetical protein [Euryarchaeota archaeon]